MSLRNVPEFDLQPGVTRLRHVELGTDLIYVGPGSGFVWVCAADGVDPDAHACHIDDAELAQS